MMTSLKKQPTDPATAGRHHHYMRDGALGCEQLVNILKIENFGVPHKDTVQSMNKRTSYTDKFAEGTQKLSLSLKIWNVLCWVVNNISEPIATTRAAQQ